MRWLRKCNHSEGKALGTLQSHCYCVFTSSWRSQSNGKWWREHEGHCSDGQESWALPTPPLCIAFSWNPVSLSLWSLGTLVLFAFPSWQLWCPGKGAILLIENILHAWLSGLGKEMYVWNLSWPDPNVSLILFTPKHGQYLLCADCQEMSWNRSPNESNSH